jgi:hypothetical protein
VGTINDDKTLNKLREIAARPVRGCVFCQQTQGAPQHDPGRKDSHRYLDPADEPVFPIRAQDESAPEVVLDWLKRNPQVPREKREEAMQFIGAALEWPRKKQAD